MPPPPPPPEKNNTDQLYKLRLEGKVDVHFILIDEHIVLFSWIILSHYFQDAENVNEGIKILTIFKVCSLLCTLSNKF